MHVGDVICKQDEANQVVSNLATESIKSLTRPFLAVNLSRKEWNGSVSALVQRSRAGRNALLAGDSVKTSL